jgi:hypothetical protein
MAYLIETKGETMKEKIKAILDLKPVWLGLGTIVGAVFGEEAANVVGTVGTLVMAIL